MANALAGMFSTFVVNGSPTKTAVVDSAGGRTQVAQLTTASLVLVVLLFATALIARLPNAALAALVFLIGVRLVDLRSLRRSWQFRKKTFAVSLATMAAVVFLGVERGIFFAVALSILDHLQQEYHPKDVVLTRSGKGWKASKAEPGAETEPGLLVYRFEAPLFFANADYFSARLQTILQCAPHPVKWLILDCTSMSDIDYTASLMLSETLARLRQVGMTVFLTQAADVQDELDRSGITQQIGADYIFESVQAAVDVFQNQADVNSV